MTKPMAKWNNLPGNGNAKMPAVSYIIKMERITVTSCTETMSCNGIMNITVSLHAGRIGCTYYNPPSSGMQSLARKFGWNLNLNLNLNLSLSLSLSLNLNLILNLILSLNPFYLNLPIFAKKPACSISASYRIRKY
jgi:hypothetical protein